ncbi:tRNA1(Val) (adenine(37)-N6)-methyltransferase [Sanguibacteroides justesenii]|uniref:tRNA1(Val) (adenine(37)-N6)-methyltransferase n=1 Tax=Sanguibacteroides justesenii TaxID=1547597 RepID=A0AB34R0U6_9PORP|nr:methyltransferase [Sanguibacteroides justesenii]KIO43148.1 tRNA (adenine-N6)-methyltransferase [Sanguibacteroides justesenii]
MGNSYFQFKQFIVRQEKCAMKVGTDGVLLGAWADIRDKKHILDIGTGSGLIALMAAQRNPKTKIHAIEIDPEAYSQAKENITSSPWADRIELFLGAIQQFSPENGYDAILCNPPFFIRSTPTPSLERTLARHCTTLSHEDLFIAVQKLLLPGGSFHVILPVTEAESFIGHIKTQKWFVNKLTKVLPNPGKAPKRLLMQISDRETIYQEDVLIIETERHVYHESYKNLTMDFYLNS